MERQIQTTLRHYLIHVIMACIKKPDHNVIKDIEREEPLILLVRMQFTTAIIEIILVVLQEIKTRKTTWLVLTFNRHTLNDI